MEKNPCLRHDGDAGLSAIIVIPVYRTPDDREEVALRQCQKMLGMRYPVEVVCPDGLDSGPFTAFLPNATFRRLAPSRFRNIKAYNALMLEPDFYRHYADYDYMLVYQPDAYVFSDNLDTWLRLGYDYIGAPWLPNDNWFQLTIGEVVRAVKRRVSPIGSTRRLKHAQFQYRVGNGGLSLRRIQCMIRVTEQYQREVASHAFPGDDWPEDVIIGAYYAHRHLVTTPDWRTAAAFSMDNALRRCYRVNGHQMPFGCHGWLKGTAWSGFWKQFIPLS